MSAFIRIAFFFVLFAVPAFAQGVPTAGTHFTFAIPEGADNVSPDFGIITTVKLVVLSPYDGEGVVYSPSGVEILFSFRANMGLEIALPYNLMLLNNLNKTNKGVIVYTTQPVNLTLHFIAPAAGEATQIFPDNALGSDYLVSVWGLFNDITEQNRTEIVVTASEDNTDVTITPTVLCLGGHPANQPINFMLDRGECFILKADTTGVPFDLSLCRTTVRSSKPVSVMSALTCAYVPLAQQACNPMLDHILPLGSADTVFYVSPNSAPDHDSRLLFIAPQDTFYLLTSSGFVYQTQNGRIELPLASAGKFITSVPTLCHQFTGGFASYFFSDPAMTTVLPERYWIDTMLWFSPVINDGFSSFIHFVSVIFPTVNGDEVLLDGNPITLYPEVYPIANSTLSAATVSIRDGFHRITSPVPVFAVSSGFLIADAYTAIALGKAPQINYAAIPTSLAANVSTAKACKDFTVSITTVGDLRMSDDIHSYQLTVLYDPALIQLVSASGGAFLPAGTFIDATVAGVITVRVQQSQTIVGSGELLQLVFRSDVPRTNLQIQSSLDLSQPEFIVLPIGKLSTTNAFDVIPHRDTAFTSLSVIARSVTLGDSTFATIFLEQPVPGMYSEVRVRIRYHHDLLGFIEVVDNSTLLVGWDVVRTEIDAETDELIFRPRGATSQVIIGKGSLTRLRFATFVTDSTRCQIQLSGYFTNTDPCPVDVLTRDTSGVFVGITSCGDSLIGSFMSTLPLRITGVIPNPIRDQFQVLLEHQLSQGEEIAFSLTTTLGDEIWNEYVSANAGPGQSAIFEFPSFIPSGAYILSATARGQHVSKNVIIQK